MIKLKIIPYSTGIAWDEIGEQLLRLKYNDDEAKGIVVKDISRQEIKGIYYEKISYIEIVHDPVAGDINENRVIFLTTHFHLYKNNILCILNPTKKVSNFITYMSNKPSISFSINEKKLNIEEFCRLAANQVSNFVVTKASFKQFNLTESLQCSMAISSKSNLFEQLKLLHVKIPNIANKITFEGHFKNQPIRCDISDTGSISISNKNVEAFLDLVISNQEHFL